MLQEVVVRALLSGFTEIQERNEKPAVTRLDGKKQLHMSRLSMSEPIQDRGIRDEALFRQHCYVNGSWLAADTGKTFPVYNPAAGKLGVAPSFGVGQTRQAVEDAHDAFAVWREFTAKQRSELLE